LKPLLENGLSSLRPGFDRFISALDRRITGIGPAGTGIGEGQEQKTGIQQAGENTGTGTE
jgi:hypothetical protein